MAFDLGGLLQQYLGGAQKVDTSQVANDYHQVVQNAPAGAVEQGLSAAFRSDQTPPFSQMIGNLFGNANPQQKSGMLGQLLGGLGPGVLGSLGGGLGGLLNGNAGSVPASAPAPAPAITQDQASQVSPDQVTEIAARAEQHDPGIVDKMSSFYVAHPDLVKTIGGAALAIALGKIAQGTRGT